VTNYGNTKVYRKEKEEGKKRGRKEIGRRAIIKLLIIKRRTKKKGGDCMRNRDLIAIFT